MDEEHEELVEFMKIKNRMLNKGGKSASNSSVGKGMNSSQSLSGMLEDAEDAAAPAMSALQLRAGLRLFLLAACTIGLLYLGVVYYAGEIDWLAALTGGIVISCASLINVLFLGKMTGLSGVLFFLIRDFVTNFAQPQWFVPSFLGLVGAPYLLRVALGRTVQVSVLGMGEGGADEPDAKLYQSNRDSNTVTFFDP